MKKLLLIGFFTAIYLHMQGTSVPSQSDEVELKQSSIDRTRPEIKSSSITEQDTTQPTVAPVEEEYSSATNFISEDEMNQIEAEAEMTSLPWDEIDEGWKSQLKEYLFSVDPERAQEMFEAYLREKSKYVDQVDFTASDSQDTEDETRDKEREQLHRNILQEIFGEYFPDIEALHSEYVESIQYLNRSGVKFSVTL
jgi:hypothetical protein